MGVASLFLKGNGGRKRETEASDARSWPTSRESSLVRKKSFPFVHEPYP